MGNWVYSRHRWSPRCNKYKNKQKNTGDGWHNAGVIHLINVPSSHHVCVVSARHFKITEKPWVLRLLSNSVWRYSHVKQASRVRLNLRVPDPITYGLGPSVWSDDEGHMDSLQPSQQQHTMLLQQAGPKNTHTGLLGTFWVTVINLASCWQPSLTHSRPPPPCWQEEVRSVLVDLTIFGTASKVKTQS